TEQGGDRDARRRLPDPPPPEERPPARGDRSPGLRVRGRCADHRLVPDRDRGLGGRPRGRGDRRRGPARDPGPGPGRKPAGPGPPGGPGTPPPPPRPRRNPADPGQPGPVPLLLRLASGGRKKEGNEVRRSVSVSQREGSSTSVSRR